MRRWLLPAVAGLLLLARYAGGVAWGARAAIAIVAAYGVITAGIGLFRPLVVRDASGPAVDVVVDGGVPVYACKECGTQLVLLRKGSDRPPRHCGEAMRYSVVPAEFEGVHDRSGPDFADTVATDDV